ncbi:hypothetical protein HB815_06305 [Listeria booriae]|uniref:hypothetical protein n=1 Tax=Listeria booriae TaxID=1552123 RepID=UPI00162A0E5A|nr:hypothetical protein [Listeria booriae]MBC1210534.1 hypothetical protein [Listeria booriae]
MSNDKNSKQSIRHENQRVYIRDGVDHAPPPETTRATYEKAMQEHAQKQGSNDKDA